MIVTSTLHPLLSKLWFSGRLDYVSVSTKRHRTIAGYRTEAQGNSHYDAALIINVRLFDSFMQLSFEIN
jgi:hypothetical protein